MINWVEPQAGVNPLEPAPQGGGYNNDTHLVYRPDLDRLEVWWRTVTGDKLYHSRLTSTDGKTWTQKELLLSADMDSDMLSPSPYFEDGVYKIYYVGRFRSGVKYVEYNDSTGTWSNRKSIDIDWGGLTPWHMDVVPSELGLEMVVQAYEPGRGSNTSNLYYVLKNGDNFSKPKLIMKPSKNPLAMDDEGMYRSSFIKKGGFYYLFNSFVSSDLSRGMALSFGKSITGLTGFDVKNKAVINGDISFYNNEVISEYNVRDIEAIYIRGSNVELRSLRGGTRNKKLTVILFSSSATVEFVNSSRIVLPNGQNYRMTYQKKAVIDLVCTSDDGNYWRVENVISVDAQQAGWTPRFTGGTYSKQFGSYIRTGNLVHAWFQLELSSKTDITSLILRGLPFPRKEKVWLLYQILTT